MDGNAPVSLDDCIPDNSTSVDDVASVSLDDDALDNSASVFLDNSATVSPDDNTSISVSLDDDTSLSSDNHASIYQDNYTTVSLDVATLTVGMPALARANSAPPSVGDTSLFSVRSLYKYLISKKLSWTIQLTHELQLCKISWFFDHSPRVTHSVIVFEDLTWAIFVHGHVSNNPSFCSIPVVLDYSSLLNLLQLLDALTILCPGHPDASFVSMAKAFKEATNPEIKAYLDMFPVKLGDAPYPATVRTSSCSLVIMSGRCESCKSYRPILRAKYSRWLKKTSSPCKYTNNRYLTTPQRQKKMKTLQYRAYSAEREVVRLKERINRSTDSKGIVVDDSLNDDLSKIMEESNSSINEHFPEGSF